MDMSFGEDRSRVRKDHADANMAALRRLALGLLKNDASKKVGIKTNDLLPHGTQTTYGKCYSVHRLRCKLPEGESLVQYKK
jgi:hypothetical protein